MSCALSSSGIWLTRLYRHCPRTADLQPHITPPCKWQGWRQPVRDIALRLYQGIMLSALNAPASHSVNELIN